MSKRYIRLLKVSVMVFLLAVLTVIIGCRAKMEREELLLDSEDAVPVLYPLVVAAYASIEQGSEAEYATPTPTSAPTPMPTPTPTPVPISTHTPALTPTPEHTSAATEESTTVAPVSSSYGGDYILSTVSDDQIGEERIGKTYVAHNVRLTAYCPCEICCGYWAVIRPVDEYGNKIVYTSTGALAVQGGTVAVNPKFIPHGSYVYVQDPYTGEWQEYRATDTSGTMNHVDIYFNDHTAALHSGYGGYGTVYWSAGPLDMDMLI